MSDSSAKKIVKNLGLVVFVGFILIIGMNIQLLLKQQVSSVPQKAINLMIFKSVFPIIIGFILGLPHCLDNLRKDGNWTYDWIRLLTLGIPALIAALIPCLYYLTPVLFKIINGDYNLLSQTGGIIAGFVIATSARK